jgi:hypothetical protein
MPAANTSVDRILHGCTDCLLGALHLPWNQACEIQQAQLFSHWTPGYGGTHTAVRYIIAAANNCGAGRSYTHHLVSYRLRPMPLSQDPPKERHYMSALSVTRRRKYLAIGLDYAYVAHT